MERQKNNI